MSEPSDDPPTRSPATSDAAIGDPAWTARWQTAAEAQTLLREDAVADATGPPRGVYTPVPIVHPPGCCQHLDTICSDCLPSWQDDLLVALFRHGPDGAAAGCRCRTCAPAQP
jgi:hypothetical protein